jgi:hypothetical protein
MRAKGFRRFRPPSEITVHNLKHKWTYIKLFFDYEILQFYNCHDTGLLRIFYPISILLFCC